MLDAITQPLDTMGAQKGCPSYLGGSWRRGCLGCTVENEQPFGQTGEEAKTVRRQRKDVQGGAPALGGVC